MNKVDQLNPGDMVGVYKIVRKIGAGGMGEIYEAWEEELSRRVAIKIISKRALENESVVERFRSEGRALAKLSNPYVVSVYFLGTVDDRPYIAMEYIEGKPLNEFLAEHPCGIKDIIEILRQTLIGLAAAHKAGIVHRDIKPHNIIVDDKLNTKIIDFGIAKVYSEQASHHTSANVFIGTINYTAPEILKGKPATSTSDIFSLGLVLYYMMTGETPFDGTSHLEVMEQVRSKELNFSNHLGLFFPTELTDIVHKMTHKEPESRYQTVAEILEDLKKIPMADLPADLNVTVAPTTRLKNYQEIKEKCRKEGFDESDIRFIVSIASDIETKKSTTAEDLLDKTITLELNTSIVISDSSLEEAMKRFRLTRSKLITQRITTDKLKTPPAGEKLQPQKSGDKMWGVVGLILCAAIGLFAYAHFNKKGAAFPQYKVGDTAKIRKRRLHKPDPEYQKTSVETVTVIAVKKDLVIFKSENGDTFESSGNPFLPPYKEVSTVDPQNHWEETNSIYGETKMLFPLKVGNRASIKIAGTRVSKNNSSQNVNRTFQYERACEVVAKEQVKTELGSHKTYKVECKSVGAANSVVVYNYDPHLQRVVLIQQDGIDPYFEEMISFKH